MSKEGEDLPELLETIFEGKELGQSNARSRKSSPIVIILDFCLLAACLFGVFLLVLHHPQHHRASPSSLRGSTKKRMLSLLPYFTGVQTSSLNKINVMPTQGDDLRYICPPDSVEESCKNTNAVPYFVHIPKSGGSTIVDLFMIVYDLTRRPLGNPSAITDYVKELKSGQKADDAVVTPFLYESSGIFSSMGHRRARACILLRDPVQRAESLFYYLQNANWEATYHPSWKSMSFEEWILKDLYEDNYLTRLLSNNMAGTLTTEHYEKARRALSSMIVGRTDSMRASLKRFESYWGISLSGDQKQLKDNLLLHPSNKNKHPGVKKETRELLEKRLNFDMMLYRYGLELYEEQEHLFEA